MNHRIIQVDDNTAILLDRLEGDGGELDVDWQVIISTFPDPEFRYNEWVFFDDLRYAQLFIENFSDHNAAQFMERAKAAHQKRTSGIRASTKRFWDLILTSIRRGS